jgi:hypothetical protein
MHSHFMPESIDAVGSADPKRCYQRLQYASAHSMPVREQSPKIDFSTDRIPMSADISSFTVSSIHQHW